MADLYRSVGPPNFIRAYDEAEQELKFNLPPWRLSTASQKLLTVCLYIAIYLPVLVLFIITVGGYSIYLIFYIKPLITDIDKIPEVYYYHSESERNASKTKGWTFFSLITWCVLWILVSHYRALRTNAGEIPKEKEWDLPSEDNSESSNESTMLIEKRKDGTIRTCARCQHRKPDRTHHCKQCERCNLKMDHHCNWIANCVGYFNYKYFFLMVFYGALALAIFICTFWETAVVVLNDETSSQFLCLFIVLSYSLGSMLGIALLGFVIFHLWLISNNYTTIEFCEKKKEITLESKISPYKLGLFDNFKEALGNEPLFWPFPFKYRDADDKGLYFKVNR
ncbi:unnamed protein product [Blepharisma stoltei]|uniref:Palmitoyltransferase n=1 Tax=Blepharisma stoltei TaxID=1481888 RepID=A0AAU9J8W3_9CILI|nr:unnamed protein product [Blepharisma stoltei]